MADRLFPFLLLLTLLDLAFVHATGVVTGPDLLPLWLLTAASPWLRKLQRLRSCRIVWNAVVLLVFALLVHHASTTGLLYMLEDGLLLAVLCQVHLLNNVGRQQRPDLVFFNSFLVAFVTSFFAPDLMWSVLFVTHAFVLVPALQVNVFARRGLPVDGPLLGLLLRDAGKRTCAICLVAAGVFVLLPRDFTRQGWLGEAITSEQQREAGISEQIRLDDEFPVRLGNEVVMRVAPASGHAEDVPSHWRALAFSSFDGTAWQQQGTGRAGARFLTDPVWESAPDGSWQRALEPGSIVVQVRLHDPDSRRLPCPLEAQKVQFVRSVGLLFDAKPIGVLGALRVDDTATAGIEYSVHLASRPGAVRPTGQLRLHMVSLPGNGVPAIVGDLAARLRQQLPATASDEVVARACSEWLQQHRRYELPGRPGFARNLGEFLVGSGAGHCEYFATALALLLRVQGIPCRLVGGYLVHEWDPEGKVMLARARHAHAWVEVLRPDGSWFTLDATPEADLMAGPAAASFWHSFTEHLTQMWNQVVGFDSRRRTEWLQDLANVPAAVGHRLLAHPFATLLGLALACAALLTYHRHRRRQTAPAIVQLERAVRAAGLSLQDGETPRELLARASGIDAMRLADLQAAALHHESSRYGRCDEGGSR